MHILSYVHNWNADSHNQEHLDEELDNVVRKLIEIGTELRNSKKIKTRSTYTCAIYKWAVSLSRNDSLPDWRSKEICGRLLRTLQGNDPEGSGFDLWHKRKQCLTLVETVR